MQRRSFLGLFAAAAGAQTVPSRDPFSFLAVRWSGAAPTARLRVSRDGVLWSEWRDVHGDAHAGASQLFAFEDGQRYLQLESNAGAWLRRDG
jgi:hypothetical protein